MMGRAQSFCLSRKIQEIQNLGRASYRKMPNCAGESNLDSIISAYEGLAFGCDLKTRRAQDVTEATDERLLKTENFIPLRY